MGKKVTANYDGIIIIIITPRNRNSAHVECRSKRDTRNNRATNHLRIIQAVPGQQSGKARNHGTTENSHIENCTCT